ncbi:hypothetical protein L1987_72952 [Smallanthus sonchifolius]|uniref:Uncharacterized protein n=1 Tax=Smallanthus sonchifolius TaxID=185202 RepID=A0ACB9AXG4_9ASTR|nr:hypothetical protein L1987_72952 [Smallanthus sonchifolius]
MTIAFRIMVAMMFVAAVVPPPLVKAVNVRKLDDTTVGSPNDEIKCGSCPCGTTCYTSPPPPSPPPPSPPPPKKPTPSPGLNCPPPPKRGGGGGGQAPPNYNYITGPPGDIYPVVQSVSAARRSFTAAPVHLLVASGLLDSSPTKCGLWNND